MMGKFFAGTLVGIGASSAATWLTRRVDLIMVQDQLKELAQSNWDREVVRRARANARLAAVGGRPWRKASATTDADGEGLPAPEVILPTPEVALNDD